ncbi:Smr-domain-containing protein [Tuber magnatum]|uniref:Smr-domain-containing protein n=1 Tax=Tuber magnatum TaxID=42249 RepID=A0A317SBF9_9PEZI|nr:Smr-domain-containing protein [Tuber magnatum]
MGQSQSTRKSEPGAVYRAKAAEHAQARAEALRKSQRALSSSNYHNAEAHSLEARMHQQKMIEFNALASREIFRHHNPKHPSNSSTSSFFGAMFSLFVTVPNDLSRLDLHGQYVSEAIPMVEDHLKRCRRQGVKKTLIITGRGAHSPGGVARIKPEVEALLVGMGVKYRRSGKGAFVVASYLLNFLFPVVLVIN